MKLVQRSTVVAQSLYNPDASGPWAWDFFDEIQEGCNAVAMSSAAKIPLYDKHCSRCRNTAMHKMSSIYEIWLLIFLSILAKTPHCILFTDLKVKLRIDHVLDVRYTVLSMIVQNLLNCINST